MPHLPGMGQQEAGIRNAVHKGGDPGKLDATVVVKLCEPTHAQPTDMLAGLMLRCDRILGPAT